MLNLESNRSSLDLSTAEREIVTTPPPRSPRLVLLNGVFGKGGGERQRFPPAHFHTVSSGSTCEAITLAWQLLSGQEACPLLINAQRHLTSSTPSDLTCH